MVESSLVGALAAVVAQVVADAMSSLGRFRIGRIKRRRAAREALDRLTDFDMSRFAVGLTPSQVDAFVRFVGSPQFGSLVLQAAVAYIADADNRAGPLLREQVRHSLRHTGEFQDVDLYAATNHVLTMVEAAIVTVRASLADGIGTPSPFQIAIAAEMAAAGIRNGELLRDLESLRDIHAFVDAFRTSIVEHNAKIWVNHAGHSLAGEFAELYVEPNLRLRSGQWISEPPQFVPTEPEDHVGSLRAAVERVPRAVVLGVPGSGKSTFANKLAHDIASESAGLVPFLIVVRDHSASLRGEHETMLHYLHAVARRPYQLQPPPRAIEYLLLNGRAIVIIDGLDELGEVHHRRGFSAMVNRFASRYPMTRIVVTSRLVGYHESRLDDDRFVAAEIAEFSDDQVKQYAGAFFAIDGRSASITRVDAFMAESAEAADLRRNPLMLSLLCMLYTSTNFIPANKPELYEKCAELLFETWDRSRGIDVPHRFSAHIKPAVQRLAWKLFTDPNSRQAIPRAELARDLMQFMRTRYYSDDDDAMQAAEDFITFCTGRPWVLAEIGSDMLRPQYGFVHRTFLEYFAAGQLVKNAPNPSAVWATLRPHVNDGGWEVAGQLAVQLLDRWHQDGADELIHLALTDANRDYAKAEMYFAFCVRSLAAVVPGNEALYRLVRWGVDRACDVPAWQRRSPDSSVLVSDKPLRILLECAAAANTERVARALVAALSARATAEGSGAILYAMLAMPGTLFGESTGPVANSIRTQIAGEAGWPPAAVTWRRLLTSPTADDVRERGIELLLEFTQGWGRSVESWSVHLLTGAGKLTAADVELLASWYSAVLDRFDAAGPARVTGIATHVVRSEVLASLPSVARATAVLLILAMARYGLRLQIAGEGPLRRLVAIALGGPPDPTAVEAVASLDLPLAAHDRVLGWVKA